MHAFSLILAFVQHMVLMILILSRITYALPAWGGQLTRQSIWMLFKQARKFVFATKIIPQPNYLTRQMLIFLSLYKDQNIVFIIFYMILLTAVLWSQDTEVTAFSLLSANITCTKIYLFYGVCSNMCSC